MPSPVGRARLSRASCSSARIRLRVGQQALALLGRRRLPAVPVQQGIAQALFEASDPAGSRWILRAVDAFARARKATGVDNGNEALQELKIEHGRSICLSTETHRII